MGSQRSCLRRGLQCSFLQDLRPDTAVQNWPQCVQTVHAEGTFGSCFVSFSVGFLPPNARWKPQLCCCCHIDAALAQVFQTHFLSLDRVSLAPLHVWLWRCCRRTWPWCRCSAAAASQCPPWGTRTRWAGKQKQTATRLNKEQGWLSGKACGCPVEGQQLIFNNHNNNKRHF